ncbi:MAG: DUF481 domain-containing protein [Candidatus Kapaibacterium sp.]|nr:DUF481 domain-containing protein [Candidatus Kapabacteria bacterium]
MRYFKSFVLCIFVFTLLIISSSNIVVCQKNTEKFRDFKSDGFYHTLNFAVNLNSGNEEYVKYAGDYRIDLYRQNFITYLAGNIEYKEGNESVITNKGFAHWRLIYNRGSFVEPELFAQIEYNDFILLKDRKLAGGGIRLALIDLVSKDSLNKFLMEMGLGLMYEYEEVDDPVKPITKYFRSTNFISLRFSINSSIDFFSVTYLQPYINNFDDYRLLNENRLQFSISKNFAFYISSVYRYDNEPHTNLKYYDLEILNGLTLSF